MPSLMWVAMLVDVQKVFRSGTHHVTILSIDVEYEFLAKNFSNFKSNTLADSLDREARILPESFLVIRRQLETLKTLQDYDWR